ncbi:MAG: zf-HC2 domain-containing protein, partial [Planctomycetota bacterium]
MTACNINESHLILYLYNELEEKEKSIFEEHLQTCRECQSELQDYNKIVKDLCSLRLLEPSKMSVIEPKFMGHRNKVSSFISYGAIAASILCLAIISYFKLSTSKPITTNQSPVVQTTSTQNKPVISTSEDAEIYSWDNALTNEIAALQESAITFTA